MGSYQNSVAQNCALDWLKRNINHRRIQSETEHGDTHSEEPTPAGRLLLLL